MIKLAPRLAASTGILACLGACASAPDHFYTLDGGTFDVSTEHGASEIVVVGPVRVPMLVDRPQLVVSEGDARVKVLEQERWATPLKNALPGLLARELTRRSDHRIFRAADSPAIGTSAARLIVDFQQIEIRSAVGVSLQAHWAYRCDSRAESDQKIGEVNAKQTLRAAAPEAYVDALRTAALGLADSLAQQLALVVCDPKKQ